MIGNIVVVIILALGCIYTLFSSMLIYSAVSRITGKELKHLMTALFITVIAGFFYGLFQLINQLGLGKGTQALSIITYAVLFIMFVMLIYLSFLTRELGKRFGFRLVGKKIKNKLESKQGRKHRL